MQQTLGDRAKASAPTINYSNPIRKYGSDPRRQENLRQQQEQNISNLQSELNYKIASEEYQRQEKLRPQIEELQELKRKDLAERIKMERAALGGDLETAGKIAYQRSLRDQRVQSMRDKAELERLGMDTASQRRRETQEARMANEEEVSLRNPPQQLAGSPFFRALSRDQQLSLINEYKGRQFETARGIILPSQVPQQISPAIRGGARGGPQYAPLADSNPFRTVIQRAPARVQEVGPRSEEGAQRMVASGGMGAANQLPAPFMPTGAANQAAPRAMPIQFTPQRTGISLTPFGGQQNEFQRAYAFGREEEELGRLRMAAEGRRLQSQMAAQPQMEAIRSGIMGRMAGRLGVSVPSGGPQPYSSGTGYTPSWSPNYRPPQFPLI